MSRTTVKHLIISLVLLVSASAFCGYALYEVNSKGTTLSEQVTVLAKEQAQEESFYRLQGIFERSKEDRERLSGYFLGQGSETIDFLNKIEPLAPESGVTLKIEGLDEAKDKKTGVVKSIDVKVTFSGTRANVERFVKILERLPYFLQVSSVSLKSRALNDWQASVSLKVFFSV